MANQFKCAGCKGIFDRGDEDEADQERQALWGDVPVEECEIVCNDCFEKFKALLAAHPERFNTQH
jgi:hypothetical protein